jgi:YVTN family beta-propeller protein/autotransporter-associated beta strand protein
MKTTDRLSSRAALLAGLYLYSFAAYGQTGPFLYVPNSGSSDVSVIDTFNNSTPFAPIAVGPGEAVAVRGDESVVYVTNTSNGTVTPLDTATNTAGTPIQVGPNPFGIAITPNGKTVYVATVETIGFPGAEGFVTPINTATNTAGAQIPVGPNPRGLAMSSDGKTLYVANLILTGEDFGAVTPIDTATNTAGTPIAVGAGNQPFSLAITPNGKTVYVANPFGDSVFAINTGTRAVTAIPVGATSFGIAITPNGKTVYVANAFANEVTVINTADNMVETSITVPGTPNGVAVSPDGKTVYVTNFTTETVTAINTTTNAIVATIPVEMMPEIFPGIAWNGNALLASGLTFVANTSGALESTLASGPTGSPGPIFTGGTLQFAGPNITSSLPITLETEGGTFDTLANNATLSGTISGAGALTKIGTGSLTLIGTNTYSGGTSFDGGIVAVNSDANLGTGPLSFDGGTPGSAGVRGWDQLK